MTDDDKPSSVVYLQKHQADVKKAKSVVIVGGGAVGVQMATDMKELYPEKEITVVQSRDQLMPQFHRGLHEIVKKRFEELGIKLVSLLPLIYQIIPTNLLQPGYRRPHRRPRNRLP